MKKRICVLAFVAGANSLLGGAQFAGIITAGGEVRVILIDSESRRVSEWLMIGQAFSGYTVQSFDRNTEMLTVESQGKTLELPLQQGSVLAGSVSEENAAR